MTILEKLKNILGYLNTYNNATDDNITDAVKRLGGNKITMTPTSFSNSNSDYSLTNIVKK